MDGYQKGHIAIQAGGLKTDNNNINARKKYMMTVFQREKHALR